MRDNPGGRPKELADLNLMARSHSKEAVERPVYWMRSDDPRPRSRPRTSSSIAAGEKPLWPSQAWLEAMSCSEVVTGVARAPDDPLALDKDQTLDNPPDERLESTQSGHSIYAALGQNWKSALPSSGLQFRASCE